MFESVSIKNSTLKLFASDDPLFIINADIKTSLPETGNRGLKFNDATDRSFCFGVKLFILPGVLCSISIDEPQFNGKFEPVVTSFLSSE